MRKIVAAVVAAFILAAPVLAAYATRSFQHRVEARVKAIEQELTERTHLETRISGVHARWLPVPAAVIDDVTVTHKGSQVVVEKARVIAVPELASLFTGSGELRRVEVQNARFVVRLEDKGSATTVIPLLRSATVPVALRGCSVSVDRGPNERAIEVQHVDLDFAPGEGSVAFSGTLSPLGERSRGEVSGTWRPGVGRTGGDGLKIDLKVRNGDPASLAAYASPLERPKFTDDVELDLTADGFLGERTTVSMPAEPLSGRIPAKVGIDLLGMKHPAVFDSGISLDDVRWVLRDGKGSWGDYPFTFAGWIARAIVSNKMNLRLSFEHVDSAAVMAEYGFEERWRPKADLTGEIRMEGTFDYPLARYEAKTPSLQFNGWPSVPISTGVATFSGSLLAINAEVSCSVQTNELKVGPAVIPNVLAGSTWWRNKLTISALNLAMLGGRIDSSVAYEPAAEPQWKGGALLHDLDVEKLVAQVLPDAGLQLTGRVDASLEGEYRKDGLWYRGRVGLHEGTFGPHNLLRQVVEEIGAATGTAVGDELASRHPTLVADKLPFKRIAMDYHSASPGMGVRVEDLVNAGGTLTLEGKVDAAKHVDAVGVAELVPPLSTDLARRIAPVGKLVTDKGSLQVPVHVVGAPADVRVTLGQDFLDALDQARQGKSTRPFTAEKPKSELDMKGVEELDEEFGR